MNKKAEINSFISYFFVGGSAAIVEWITFWILEYVFHYSIATAIAFITATFFNYILGRKATFKNYSKSKHDIFSVFFVSGIGLLLNTFFMYILVEKIHIYPLFSKILSTGIVFFWNYTSRRLLIYRTRL